MYAVIAEDQSDVDTLAILIRRLANNSHISVKGKGYNGCGEMLKKGSLQLKSYKSDAKIKRFIICYDSDGNDANTRRKKLIDAVITPANLQAPICALIPVHEIEAWILADLVAVQKIFTGWQSVKPIPNPESIKHPKEYLENLSRQKNQRPRYSHATHNPVIASYLNLNVLQQKCPSFKPLVDIVCHGTGNI